jgi:hypothetical protein
MAMDSCVGTSVGMGVGVSVGIGVIAVHAVNEPSRTSKNSLLIMRLYSLSKQGHNHFDYALA